MYLYIFIIKNLFSKIPYFCNKILNVIFGNFNDIKEFYTYKHCKGPLLYRFHGINSIGSVFIYKKKLIQHVTS